MLNSLVERELERHGFEIYVPRQEIQVAVDELADRISQDYKDKEPHLIITLKGAVTFGMNLAMALGQRDLPVTYDFLGVSSYEGENSTGVVKLTKPLEVSAADKDIILIEDILDTGMTMDAILKLLPDYARPRSIEVAVLLDKQDRRIVQGLNPKYVGLSIPDRFVVGYGLDFNEQYRHVQDIWAKKIEPSK